jgi:hypothetical protein
MPHTWDMPIKCDIKLPARLQASGCVAAELRALHPMFLNKTMSRSTMFLLPALQFNPCLTLLGINNGKKSLKLKFGSAPTNNSFILPPTLT